MSIYKNKTSAIEKLVKGATPKQLDKITKIQSDHAKKLIDSIHSVLSPPEKPVSGGSKPPAIAKDQAPVWYKAPKVREPWDAPPAFGDVDRGKKPTSMNKRPNMLPIGLTSSVKGVSWAKKDKEKWADDNWEKHPHAAGKFGSTERKKAMIDHYTKAYTSKNFTRYPEANDTARAVVSAIAFRGNPEIHAHLKDHPDPHVHDMIKRGSEFRAKAKSERRKKKQIKESLSFIKEACAKKMKKKK